MSVSWQELEELDNPFQVERCKEVLQHGAIAEVREDEVSEGQLVVELEQETATMWGVYAFLYIDRGGNIAEAMVNHPFFYATFGQLLQGAAVRTATT